MAVDALELRPRNAVALVDAALRLCATTSGVWALTLPSGALLVAALFALVEAVRRGEPLFGPVALWTGAWVLRALTQGAACHHVEQLVLGTTTPSARSSLKAALARAPGLVVASAWMAMINTVLWGFTLGIGFLFVGAHAAGYAATMRGQGSVLGLYSTCTRLLGPARHVAPWVRIAGLVQLVLAVNLHLFVQGGLSVGGELFGFDVTFLERFASLDNPTWLATIAAVTFALFEPVRAATGALLLIDGRVRQEGLDLLSQLEQLPQRKRPRGVSIALAALLAVALPARAETALAQRAANLSDECAMHALDLSPLDRVRDEDQSATSRFLSRVERRVFEDGDCEGAEDDLREGLRLFAELQAQPAGLDAQQAAKDILSRREFQGAAQAPEAPKEEDDEGQGWFARLLKALLEWLRGREPDRDPQVDLPQGRGVDMAGANAVMIGALALVTGVLLFILVRSLQRRKPAELAPDDAGGLVQQPLEHDAMSALSKPPETWAGLADALAARGEYREAIRHLYLALLARLHRDGVIDYDPTLSNWEYLFAFKGASALKSAFKELTRRFDFAWYGNLGNDALAYASFRKVAEPLLGPSREGANAGA